MPNRLLISTALTGLLCFTGCAGPEAHMASADQLFSQGRYSQALMQYQKVRRRDPSMPGLEDKIRDTQVMLHFERGDTLLARRQWDRAAREYEAVRRLEPNNTEVGARLQRLSQARADHLFSRGQELLAQGNPPEATRLFEQALVFQPNHPGATAALERTRQAEIDRRQRIESAYENGVRARQGKRYESALRYFAEVLEIDPQHGGARADMRAIETEIVDQHLADGDAAMQSRRFDEALAAYRRAAARQPNLPGLAARMHRAELEARADALVAEADQSLARKEWRQAFDKLESACSLTSDPERLEARLSRARDGFVAEIYDTARAHERADRYGEALSCYGTVVEYHPTYRDAAELHRSLTRRLADAEAAYDAGLDAHRSCDLVMARKHFRTCVEALARYRDAKQRLADIEGSIATADQLYTRAGQAEAKEEYRRARLLYEECLAIAHPYRDADERLVKLQKRVRRKIEVAEWALAQQAQTARDLLKARDLYRTCERSDPKHEDTHQRLRDIDTALSKAGAAYEEAVRLEAACELERARDAYSRCLVICTPFRDAVRRLEGVRESLRELREAERLDRARRLVAARELYRKILHRHSKLEHAARRLREIDAICTDLEDHHKKMVAAKKARHFRQALDAGRRIHKHCVDFHDVEVQITVLETEADYADGEAFLAQGNRDAALRSFKRCEKRKKGFRDVARKIREIHGMIEHARPAPGHRR